MSQKANRSLNYSGPNQNLLPLGRGKTADRWCGSVPIVFLTLFLLWGVLRGQNRNAYLRTAEKTRFDSRSWAPGDRGCVPAERHADTARDAANAAHERELKVRQPLTWFKPHPRSAICNVSHT